MEGHGKGFKLQPQNSTNKESQLSLMDSASADAVMMR